MRMTGRRAGGRRKFLLYNLVDAFCGYYFADREDGLLFLPLVDPDGLTTVGVVQHVTISGPRGTLHRFRLFSGKGFVPELCLSSYPVLFTEHAIQRFTERVKGEPGLDLGRFLRAAVCSQMAVMKVNCAGRALVMESQPDGLIALTYEIDHVRYVVTTCLTRSEIVSMEPVTPPHLMHFHFRGGYVCPPPGEQQANLPRI
jgi:hypothetical protein